MFSSRVIDRFDTVSGLRNSLTTCAHAVLSGKDKTKTNERCILKPSNTKCKTIYPTVVFSDFTFALPKACCNCRQALPEKWQALPKKWQGLPLFAESLRKNKLRVDKIGLRVSDFEKAGGVFSRRLGKTLNNLYLCRKPLIKH